METAKIAKNLLLDKTCMNCTYFSNVYRLRGTGKKQQCIFNMQQVKPLPDKLTCDNWRLASGKAR